MQEKILPMFGQFKKCVECKTEQNDDKIITEKGLTCFYCYSKKELTATKENKTTSNPACRKCGLIRVRGTREATRDFVLWDICVGCSKSSNP